VFKLLRFVAFLVLSLIGAVGAIVISELLGWMEGYPGWVRGVVNSVILVVLVTIVSLDNE
jgi:hypothetical protein